MPYFCVTLRNAGAGGSASGTFLEADDNFKVVSPQIKVGADFSVDDLDLAIGALPDTTTIVTFWGSGWFHTIGPNAREKYGSIVDLGGAFVANRRFSVKMTALDAVSDHGLQDAAALVAILQTIGEKGRLTWTKQNGSTGALWIPNFYVPLRNLRHVRPPAWITAPQTLDLQMELL